MDRPLWQILLTLFVVAFTAQRAVVAFLLADLGASDAAGAIAAPYVVQALAGAATALGLWLGHRWVLGALVLLGLVVAATGLFESFYLGVRPPLAAVGQVAVAALATGAMFLILDHEFSGDGPGPAA